MKVEWQWINGEQYFNDPVAGWLKRLPLDTTIPQNALYACGTANTLSWRATTYGETTYQFSDFEEYGLVYAVPCDPPCILSPQASLDVCLEYVSYRVSKATKGMQPEVKEAFLQKVYALKQTFALEVEKLLEEVKHG